MVGGGGCAEDEAKSPPVQTPLANASCLNRSLLLGVRGEAGDEEGRKERKKEKKKDRKVFSGENVVSLDMYVGIVRYIKIKTSS